jgi:hypothetical protein
MHAEYGIFVYTICPLSRAPAPRTRRMGMLEAVLLCAATILVSLIRFADGNAITTIELFRFGHDRPTPCVRIPSLATLPGSGGVVIALAECRQFVGDGCRPWDNDNSSLTEPSWGANRYICTRRSTDYGRSFGPWNHNITGMRSWNPATAVIRKKHSNTSSVLLFFNDGDAWLKHRPSAGGTPWMVHSLDGITWSQASPISIVGPLPARARGGFNLGPGRALVLDSGRIVLAGGSSVALGKCPQRPDGGVCKQLTSFVLHSDDNGRTFQVSDSVIPNLEEPQLAEYALPQTTVESGDSKSLVILNGRQNNSFPTGSPCGCRGQVYSTDEGLSFSGNPPSVPTVRNSDSHIKGHSDASGPGADAGVMVSWVEGLPSPSVQSSIIRSPRSGRLVFSGPRSHDRSERVNFTVMVSSPRASVEQLWGANATHISLSHPTGVTWPCFGYMSNCAGYSCLAIDENPRSSAHAATAARQESVLVLWETGVESGCTGAACRIMLSHVPLPLL